MPRNASAIVTAADGSDADAEIGSEGDDAVSGRGRGVGGGADDATAGATAVVGRAGEVPATLRIARRATITSDTATQHQNRMTSAPGMRVHRQDADPDQEIRP